MSINETRKEDQQRGKKENIRRHPVRNLYQGFFLDKKVAFIQGKNSPQYNKVGREWGENRLHKNKGLTITG